MNRIAKWIGGTVLVLCALFAGLVQIVLPGLMDKAIPYVEKTAADYINGSVTVGSVSKSGLTELLVKDITLKDNRQRPVAVMPETRISLNPLKAFSGVEKAVSSVELVKPTLYIRQDKDETWNFNNLLKPSESETTPFYGKAEVKQGTVVAVLPEGTWEYRVEGFVDGSYNPAFDLNFTVDGPGMDTARVLGSIDNKGTGKIVMKSSRVDLAPYGPLALRYGQVKEAAGQVTDIDGEWNNDGKDTVLRGTCNLQDVRGNYRFGEQEVPIRVTGQVSSSDHSITAKELQVSLNGQKAVLSGSADIRDLDHPAGHVALRSDRVSYAGETVADLEAEAVLAEGKAAINLIHAAYRGGSVTGQGVYDLKNGKIIGETNIRNVTLDGEKTKGEKFLLNAALAGNGTYDREKGNLAVNVAANTMNLKWRDMLLNVMDFDADVTEKGVSVQTFSAFAGTGVLQGSGTVSFDGDYDLKGRMTEMPLAPVLAAAGQEGGGLVSASYHLYGHGGNVNFDGPVQLQQAVYKDLHLTEGHGLVTVRNNIIKLDEYQLNMDQGAHVADGTIDIGNGEPVFDLVLDTEKVRVEPLLSAAGLQGNLKATGNLTNHMHITGTMPDLSIKGTVDMSDGSVEGYLVDAITGGYVYHNGGLRLDNILVKALSTTLQLHGEMDAAHNLDFQAVATDVDLSRLPVRDEDVKLGGKASFKGHLSGTMERPLFAGDVTSEEFLVNDVPVNNLTGTLVTNGQDINSLRGSCEQKNTDGLTSAYMIDLALNIPRKDLRGKIGIMYGDLQNILKMLRSDLPIKGLAAGTLEFNGPDADTVADFWGYKLDINNVKYDQMALKARLNKGLLTLDRMKLQEDRAFQREGTISAKGTVDFRNRKIDMTAQAADANPAILTAFMKEPVALTGSLNMSAHLAGTLDEPEGKGNILLSGGSIADVTVDQVTADLALAKDTIVLQNFSAERDIYKLTAAGNIPVDVFRSEEKRRNPNAQMNIRADFNQASLAILGAHPAVDWGLGDAKGILDITGTLEEPRLYGNVEVKDGCLKLKDIYSVVDKINLKVAFQGDRIQIENATAALGKGTIEGSGTYDLKASDENAYHFTGNAKNAEIDSAIFKGRINGTFSVTPEHYRVPRRLLQKQAGTNSGTVPGSPQVSGMEEGWRTKITADVRLDDVLVNMPTVPSLGEGNSNLGLDVSVNLGPKVHLFNKYLYDLWLKGGIHILGSTVFPRITGGISTDKGNVTYLRTRFKVEKGSVHWSEPGTFLPSVKLDANAKFSRYRIALQLDGPLSKDNLNFVLRSNPPLSQNALVRMLTLQRSSAGSDDISNEDMYNLHIAGLETGFLGDVERTIAKALGLDEFRVYIGKVENGVDFDNRIIREMTQEEKSQYNFLVAKNLTERWKIGYTRSFDGRYDNIYTQYQITDHMNVTISQDENHDKRYSVEYRITF